MDGQTLRYGLTIPLIEKDYGNNAAEVLKTCSLVAEYAEEHTPDQVKEFQKRVEINPQVWSRLIALHRDQRLKKHIEHLPPSYTALYAIHRLKDEELETALHQGVITPKASSHSILFWLKSNRKLAGNGIPPWRCLMVFDRELDGNEFNSMRQRIDEILLEYNSRLLSESDYIPPDSSKDRRKQELISDLEEMILQLALPIYEGMTEHERHAKGIQYLPDFLDIDLSRFRAVAHFVRGREAKGSQQSYTPIYVYRIALEFQRTDSRSQRFNYKRRLRQLAENQSDLKDVIDEVLRSYMST